MPEGASYKMNNMEERELQNLGGFKPIYPLNEPGKVTDEATDKVQMHYEDIMNRFLFR